MSEVIDHKEYKIKQDANKTDFNAPGEGQFQFGLGKLLFDFGIFF